MMRPRLLAVWLGMAVCLGFGCRTANLLAEQPTSIASAPSPVASATRRIPSPTLSPPPPPPPIPPGQSPALPSPTLSPTLVPTPFVATLPPGCASSNQVITSPAHESAVFGLIEIIGAANKPEMQYWKVEYRAETSTEYVTLNRGEKAIVNEVLARLSTKTLPNGAYLLRLVIVQKDGNFGTPCEIRVIFAN